MVFAEKILLFLVFLVFLLFLVFLEPLWRLAQWGLAFSSTILPVSAPRPIQSSGSPSILQRRVPTPIQSLAILARQTDSGSAIMIIGCWVGMSCHVMFNWRLAKEPCDVKGQGHRAEPKLECHQCWPWPAVGFSIRSTIFTRQNDFCRTKCWSHNSHSSILWPDCLKDLTIFLWGQQLGPSLSHQHSLGT